MSRYLEMIKLLKLQVLFSQRRGSADIPDLPAWAAVSVKIPLPLYFSLAFKHFRLDQDV
jgi:hypothetical protein